MGVPSTFPPNAKKVAEGCPNDMGLSSQVPDVVSVYRRILSAQSDGAVTMIAVSRPKAPAIYNVESFDGAEKAREALFGLL